MKGVDFIIVEDRLDLVVSFAIAPRAHRSLTLHRSRKFELLTPDQAHGVFVSFDPTKPEGDLLRTVRWDGNLVTLTTAQHEYTLDIAAVADAEISAAKQVLRRMVSDGTASFEDSSHLV
jgi:hypothetical protein